LKKSEIKICFFELSLVLILFFALFAQNIFTRSVVSMIMLIYAVIVCKLLKKRKIDSIYKNQITILLIIFAIIYISAFYLFGIYFGYSSSDIKFSFWTMYTYIIPLSITIISTEIIRKIFLSQKLILKIKSKKINLSSILTYIYTVLIDLLIYTKIYDFSNLDNVLTSLGFVLFASLSCNLLYNYISKRYDEKGIIIYRLITTLFVYIIPVTPNLYIFFRSFFRMLYPYIIYLIIDKLYSKTDFAVSHSTKRRETIGTIIIVAIITMIIMLISCQFRYGILVIGSESMKGSLNKGDAVIFEKYNGQDIITGQVIIFEYNGIRIIHRIIESEEVNGIIRYYTKGDANTMKDDGYRTKKDIYGIVNLRVKYIGYPTLFVRSLFE